MSAPGIDERLHRDALVALLSPLLTGYLYDHGMVPGGKGVDGTTNAGALPDTFTVLEIERDPVLITRMCGLASRSAWAATFETSGRYVANVRRVQSVIAGALEGARITVDGHMSTPIAFEAARPIRPNESYRHIGRVTATYTL